MGNLFNTPLPSTARSSEYGYPNETFDFPNGVDLDDSTYPDLTGVSGGVSELRSNTGEVFQGANPEYAGQYVLGFENDPGIAPSYAEQVPAPGSQSLIAPRNTGEVTGNNRILRSDGPVDGGGADGGNTWSGVRAQGYRPNPNYGGPVVGGQDYATQLQNAYYASVLQSYSSSASDQAMVNAV